MAPNEVTIGNQQLVYDRLYPKPLRADPKYGKYIQQKKENRHFAKLAKKKFKVGDLVRRMDNTNKFNKESDPNFSKEIFRIHEIRDPMELSFRSYDQEPVTFKLMSLRGRLINGSFYDNQLQKVLQ